MDSDTRRNVYGRDVVRFSRTMSNDTIYFHCSWRVPRLFVFFTIIYVHARRKLKTGRDHDADTESATRRLAEQTATDWTAITTRRRDWPDGPASRRSTETAAWAQHRSMHAVCRRRRAPPLQRKRHIGPMDHSHVIICAMLLLYNVLDLFRWSMCYIHLLHFVQIRNSLVVKLVFNALYIMYYKV